MARNKKTTAAKAPPAKPKATAKANAKKPDSKAPTVPPIPSVEPEAAEAPSVAPEAAEPAPPEPAPVESKAAEPEPETPEPAAKPLPDQASLTPELEAAKALEAAHRNRARVESFPSAAEAFVPAAQPKAPERAPPEPEPVRAFEKRLRVDNTRRDIRRQLDRLDKADPDEWTQLTPAEVKAYYNVVVTDDTPFAILGKLKR